MNKGLATNVPDVTELSLDEVDLESMAAEVEMILMTLDRPRANLGNSGPPGRVD